MCALVTFDPDALIQASEAKAMCTIYKQIKSLYKDTIICHSFEVWMKSKNMGNTLIYTLKSQNKMER